MAILTQVWTTHFEHVLEAVLRALLDAHPDAIKDADPDDLMPLHVAIEQQATSLPRLMRRSII